MDGISTINYYGGVSVSRVTPRPLGTRPRPVFGNLDYQSVIKRTVETQPKNVHVSTLMLKPHLIVNNLRTTPWPRPATTHHLPAIYPHRPTKAYHLLATARHLQTSAHRCPPPLYLFPSSICHTPSAIFLCPQNLGCRNRQCVTYLCRHFQSRDRPPGNIGIDTRWTYR